MDSASPPDGHPRLQKPLHEERPLKVICIGAGASGLLLAYKLQRSFEQFELVLYEKNDAVSGTWYENKYPGYVNTLKVGLHKSFRSSRRGIAAPVMYRRIFTPGASNRIRHGLQCMQDQMKYSFTSRISVTNTTFANTASFNMKLLKLLGMRLKETGM
jgi:hypothetical protein